MELFQLLQSKTGVRFAPGKKVIPSKEITDLLSLQQLQKLSPPESTKQEYHTDPSINCARGSGVLRISFDVRKSMTR